MELNILLRLLIAHLLSDFVFQPSSWVKDRELNKERSRKLYLHVLVTSITAYVFLGSWSNWWIPLIILVTHLGIDIWKSYRPGTFLYFALDQFFHVLVILVIWLCSYFTAEQLIVSAENILNRKYIWALMLGYIIVIWPLGTAIGKATEKWRNEAGGDTGGLERAGKWIGRCERILVLTFIIANQYTALGFLMTAKSILRFSEKEAKTQQKTEYILVGTLISFASAALIGIIIAFLLK